MKKVLFMAFLLGSGAACQNEKSPSGQNAIIGNSDFVVVEDEKKRSKHGFLDTGERRCNAFLSGAREVTAALHCIGDDPLAFVGFQYEAEGGLVTGVVDVLFLDDKKDMVTYAVEKSFDSYYEFASSLDLEAKIKVVGIDHSIDKVVETACDIKDLLLPQAAIEYTCDTKSRFSGSPIVQGGKVVGVHIGYNPEKNVNYGLNIGQLLDDKADIATLEVDARLEWPHVRSPHVRSPHVRQPHVRVGNFNISNIVQRRANTLAMQAKNDGKASNEADCQIIVSAALAAWGAQVGGPWGAAIGGASGVAASRLACRLAFGG